MSKINNLNIITYEIAQLLQKNTMFDEIENLLVKKYNLTQEEAISLISDVINDI